VRAADLLFRIVSHRYERKILVLTTNLPVSDWPIIFPSAVTVTGLIDRVVDHVDIIPIEGESYRHREAASARKPPRDTPGGQLRGRSQGARFLMPRNSGDARHRRDSPPASGRRRRT
jgi:hypothetical protein